MTGLLTVRLQQASANATAMWATLARARGHDVREQDGFTVIDGPAGARVMVTTPEPGDGLAETARCLRDAGVVVEDPFATLDLTAIGLTARQLPVMVREPAPAPEPAGVTRVASPADLVRAGGIVVDGFPLEHYRADDAFPPSLLEQDGPAIFTRGDAGACLTMAHGGVGGAYWVATLPEHRSKGVGRALMHAVLRHFDGLPVTLTAARPGKPLYDSLGFVTVGEANWWR
ncbi:GNAT family N-acetyltransferase [Amycolatopsis sp., V23-08]|uniref:GNAT family N-acetyltransferase n=1 Tax=Amycolatopsis heterodermiae TaxID=3110235 RepID=A0ABU5QVT1_9PSEU|nr:GNAT family N-acetyltransferase [Amycolatopsis sp., V23-08]MEA5358032.1 GNAT family N-acetyltransferase [Amycolatopsis sp., V23-08]